MPQPSFSDAGLFLLTVLSLALWGSWLISQTGSRGAPEHLNIFGADHKQSPHHPKFPSSGLSGEHVWLGSLSASLNGFHLEPVNVQTQLQTTYNILCSA